MLKISLPKEILIATNNKGKFLEIKDLLTQINISALPTFQFKIAEPEETGSSFAENSLLKAKYYATKTNLFALADDSGLAIDVLDKLPGIYSARWAIDEKGNKNFSYAYKKIAQELQKIGYNIFEDKISASFICNLSLFDPKTNFEISFEGKIEGQIIFPPRGDNGFGYDAIFIKNGYNLTFSEMDGKLKDQISHRAIAFNKMLAWLT
jgi:XTP/dITP diphosphohydrolase